MSFVISDKVFWVPGVQLDFGEEGLGAWCPIGNGRGIWGLGVPWVMKETFWAAFGSLGVP